MTSLEPSFQNINPDNTVYEPDNTVYEPDNTVYEPDNTVYEPDNTGYEPDNTVYTPDNTMENFINYSILPNGNYSLVPFKIKEYNNKIINELANYYKININIIKLINHNLMINILNSKNLISDSIDKLNGNRYIGLYVNYEKNYRTFDNRMNKDINDFLNKKEFHQNFDDYSIFVDFIFRYYKYKYTCLIVLINFHFKKIISINNKVNKILNFVSFLKQKKNRKIVTDFVYKRIDEYEQNKIILQYYDELRELELNKVDIINNIFSRHDLRQVTFLILKNQNNKNDNLSFIYKILSFNKSEITNIKKEITTLDLIKNKLGDFNFIFDTINKINSIESEINYLNYNINLYVHRQKIVNNYSKYLKTLYNYIVEKVGYKLSDDIYYNLIINKKHKPNVMKFLFSIIKTKSEDLILL